jgi:hypothetical protein
MIAKQIKRRNFCGVRIPVETVAVAALASAMLLALTMSAGAASPAGITLVANVPFDFYCGEKHFPPGQYYVGNGTDPGSVVTIHSVAGKKHGWFLGVPQKSTPDSDMTPSLRFTRYRDGRSYLREVRNPFLVGSYLPKSRAEREPATMLMVEAQPASVTIPARVR